MKKPNPKDAIGRRKPSRHYTPPCANFYEGKVLEIASKDYGYFNWRESKIFATVYYDAICRHLDAWLDGEDLCPKSGLPHLAHIRANTAILLDAKEVGSLIDDRPPKGTSSEVIRKLTLKKEKR